MENRGFVLTVILILGVAMIASSLNTPTGMQFQSSRPQDGGTGGKCEDVVLPVKFFGTTPNLDKDKTKDQAKQEAIEECNKDKANKIGLTKDLSCNLACSVDDCFFSGAKDTINNDCGIGTLCDQVDIKVPIYKTQYFTMLGPLYSWGILKRTPDEYKIEKAWKCTDAGDADVTCYCSEI